MKNRLKRERGQALVEYIIIIVIVAVVSLVVLGAFSDRIRDMISGATTSLGGEGVENERTTSLEQLRDLKAGGIDPDAD